ncbi:hypothetical protein [Prosthecomicrobium sp. N25]|uniref:hypothetical protein n=1 Tax=Prosthecomicrobium sp. N25 TaxID=3129254 RepID=UPI003078709F
MAGPGRRAKGGALLAAACLAALPAAAQGVKTFSAQDLMKGTTATREQCAALPRSVFVEALGERICIRYYMSGPAQGRSATVFFPGDSFGADPKGRLVPDPGYLTQAPEYLDAAVRVWSQRLGSPVIFFGRMGLHGSSGWHGNRRTRLEVAVTRAALDAIKVREGVTGFAVVGQSGGGLLAAAALAARDDVSCAAIASAPLDFNAFARRFGITVRLDGKRAHYDGLADVPAAAARTGSRVIVLTDPDDKDVPASTQTPYVEALRAAGARPLHLFTAGRLNHALTEKAMFATALCLSGKPDQEIEKRYGRTAADDLPPP